MIKRIACLLIAIALCVCCLTSCDSSSIGSINDLINAPKYSGELYDIQQALYAYAGRSVNLRYPRTGDNRTAFTRYDFDGDSVEEAIAFYSSANIDGIVEVHINVIDQIDGRWRSVCDTTTGASDIHRVDISPLSASGVPVIAVGSELYSATGNQLKLYTYSKGKLSPRMQTNYTDFMLCDLMGKGYKQLVTLEIKPSERVATASVYTVDGDSTDLLGAAPLDGNVSDFASVIEGRLSDGRAAVFIDSVKSATATITDAVYFDGDKLTNPFFNSAIAETQSTLRATSSLCTDINGDGVTDIPSAEVLLGYETQPNDQRKYLTVWRSFDGTSFKNTLVGDFNYESGYYLTFPSKWLGKVTLITADQDRMRSYRVWDEALGTTGEEIVRIRVYTAEDYEKIDNTRLIELARDDNTVWAARIIKEGDDLGIDAETLKQNFNLL